MRTEPVCIEWLDEIKDCYFKNGENWYPGWAVARITLPYTQWTHTFYLVRDFSGVAHWIPAIKFRDDLTHLFDQHPNLDWRKIYHFDPLPENKRDVTLPCLNCGYVHKVGQNTLCTF